MKCINVVVLVAADAVDPGPKQLNRSIPTLPAKPGRRRRTLLPYLPAKGKPADVGPALANALQRSDPPLPPHEASQSGADSLPPCIQLTSGC